MRVYAYRYKDFFDKAKIKYTIEIHNNGKSKEVRIVVDENDLNKLGI